MGIAVVGAGHIGASIVRRLTLDGHEVQVSFAPAAADPRASERAAPARRSPSASS